MTTTSAAASRPAHRAPRAARLLAGWLGLLVVVGLAGFLWPTSLGGCTTMVVVSGGSMEPTYAAGDLLLARCGETAVGDVVVYEPPTVPGGRVVHRIIGGDAAGWELQGDANEWVDPWQPDQGQVLGRVVLHVPGFGLAPLLLDPIVWVSFIVAGAGTALWPGPRAKAGAVEADVELAVASRVRSRRHAAPTSPRRRVALASAIGLTAVLVAIAVVPVPADAASLPLGGPALLAWTADVDIVEPKPDLPAVSCTTPNPALPCTATVRMIDAWDGGYNFNVDVRDARTNGSRATVPWTVTIDFSESPFPWVPKGLDAAGLVTHSTCADLPVLVVTGSTDWGQHHLLGAGESRTVWLQGHNVASGNLLACH